MCVWNKCEWVQIRKLFPYMALGALLLHSEWSCNWPESVTFLFHSVMGVTNVLHSIYNYYSKPPSWISFCFHFYHCHHNYLLKKIYWSIVDWQCWLSFRCATQWFSFTDIHSFFSCRLSQNVEQGSLCSRALLVFCLIHSSVYVFTPSSWFIPPPPSILFSGPKFVPDICKSVSVL